MEFFNSHTKLFTAAFLLFAVLTFLVCIVPALNNQANNAPLPFAQPLSAEAVKGKAVFISNGCVACHTQQVRNVDMDKIWGERPSIAADYADNHRTDFWRNTSTLMGTERTGPDLTNIGTRQPSIEWHLSHLFNPRIVVKNSIMPSYRWMFEIRNKKVEGDISVSVPEEFMEGKMGVVIAKEEALQLVAYLQELKQTKLPSNAPQPAFLYEKADAAGKDSKPGSEKKLNGAMLYANNCQSCHQQNGEGLKGAFPPLKGSKVVLDENAELLVNIIMNGYSGREKEGFGVMPAVGTNNRLKPEEVAAIMNHERSSWGNNAKKVTVDEVKKFMEKVKVTAK